jgi:protein dithiol:quinone oxidoreductase
MSKISHRVVATWGALFSIAALAAALYLQLTMNWFPCPLCILQRYAYLAVALGFFMCWLTKGKGAFFSLFKGWVVVSVVAGAGAAFYHVWVLANPLQTCGVDPLQHQLNALPWVHLWPALFEADGLCSEVYPPLFGLSLPLWSGLGFLGLGLLAWFMKKPVSRWLHG